MWDEDIENRVDAAIAGGGQALVTLIGKLLFDAAPTVTRKWAFDPRFDNMNVMAGRQPLTPSHRPLRDTMKLAAQTLNDQVIQQPRGFSARETQALLRAGLRALEPFHKRLEGQDHAAAAAIGKLIGAARAIAPRTEAETPKDYVERTVIDL